MVARAERCEPSGRRSALQIRKTLQSAPLLERILISMNHLYRVPREDIIFYLPHVVFVHSSSLGSVHPGITCLSPVPLSLFFPPGRSSQGREIIKPDLVS